MYNRTGVGEKVQGRRTVFGAWVLLPLYTVHNLLSNYPIFHHLKTRWSREARGVIHGKVGKSRRKVIFICVRKSLAYCIYGICVYFLMDSVIQLDIHKLEKFLFLLP